jgi:predicted transcriptional regulator
MAADITIRDVMTKTVLSVALETSLEDAGKLMEEQGIRHLPVLDEYKLVGVVSQRELELLRSLPGVDLSLASVGDVMADTVYTVAPGEPLRDVARVMADGKMGSAVVFEGGVVMGIFTTIDALRVIEKFL